VAVGTVGVGFHGHGSHLGEMKIVDVVGGCGSGGGCCSL
jgi:hypothetical protein